ncbi:MAG: hypothetical protein P8020_21365 [Acidobacteriota bacterium]
MKIYPDSGGLGPIRPEAAQAALLYSADQWSAIPSASIVLQDAGFVESVAGPEGPGDFTAQNIFDFIGVNNGGVSPIVFDNQDDDQNGNGDIFDLLGLDSGVLGVSFLDFAEDTTITEGVVIFNGATVDPADTEGESFSGVFTHELGHLLNLGHTVVNGQALFFGGSDAMTPDGQPMLVEPEDVETMYPFLDPALEGTARWQAVPHRDDVAMLSTLYPNSDLPLTAFGSIRGRLVDSKGVGYSGAQIIARNRAGDPLQDAVSVISGDFQEFEGAGKGTYLLNALTPGGRYSLELRDTVAGGFSAPVFASPDALFYPEPGLLPGPEEYFSGYSEDAASPPDDPGSPPFLIDVAEGGAGSASVADIKLNSSSAPVNDLPTGALLITPSELPYSDFRQTRGAGDLYSRYEPPADCGFGLDTHSVWYRFQNDTDYQVYIVLSTDGTNYETVIQVFSDSLSPVYASNSHDCATSWMVVGQAQLGFVANANTEYLIKVADVGLVPTGGELFFHVEMGVGHVPTNDICRGALPVTNEDLPYLSKIRTLFATRTGDPDSPCANRDLGSPRADFAVWYQFTNTASDPVTLLASTSGTEYDTVLQAYSDNYCRDPASSVCNDDAGGTYWFDSEVRITVDPDQAILFQAIGYEYGGGDLIFHLDRVPPPPANDDFDDAAVVGRRQLPFLDLVDTSEAQIQTDEPATQCGSTEKPLQSASVWYRLNNDLTIPLDIDLSTAGSEFDTVVQVYSEEGSALTPLACDDGSESGARASLTFRAEPGRSYPVKVAALGDSRGGNLVFAASAQGGTSGDLVLTAVPPDRTPTAGGQLQYSMDIRSLASSAASNVQLSVHPAPDLELVSAETPQGECVSDGDLVCSLGTVQPGGDVLVKIHASPQETGTTSLSAVLSWDGSQSGEESRSVTLVSDVAPFLVFPSSLQNQSGGGPNGPLVDIGTDFIGNAVFNPSQGASELALEGLGADGSRMFLLDPPTPLAAQGQKAFTAGDFGRSAISSTMLIARGSGDPLEGFFMSGDLGLTRLDGIGGSLGESKSLYFQIARETAEESTSIVLFNATLESASPVEIVLHDTKGSVVSTDSIVIPSPGTVQDCLRGLFHISGSFEGGYLSVNSPVSLRGFEFHGSSSYLEALPAKQAKPVVLLWSPHFFLDQQEGHTEVRLLNLDPGIVKVQAQAFGDDGSELATATFDLEPAQLVVKDVGTLFGLSAPETGSLSGYLRLTVEPRGYLGTFTPRASVMGSVSFSAQGGRARSTLSMIPAPLSRE